jgi:hypothetical protein
MYDFINLLKEKATIENINIFKNPLNENPNSSSGTILFRRDKKVFLLYIENMLNDVTVEIEEKQWSTEYASFPFCKEIKLTQQILAKDDVFFRLIDLSFPKEEKTMSIAEIEKILGYKIKIVGEKNED